MVTASVLNSTGPQVVHYKNSDRTVPESWHVFHNRANDQCCWLAAVAMTKIAGRVYTANSKNSAQWEHTLVVTGTGCEVLTTQRRYDPRIMKNA
ncbi:hypothetical protein O9992_04595 [Vibrio lentus]|nr:hypothetical protein [Vibrio lentus]